jgi:hypothetical protein
VSFLNDPLSTFSGTLLPGGSSDTVIQVPADTVFATLQIGWGPLWSVSDLGLYVYDPAGNLRAQSNSINLPGLTGKTEHVVLSLPAAGAWRIRVKNGSILGLSQDFAGAVQFNRVSYGQLLDAGLQNASLRSDVNQILRSFSMWPIGSKFRPEFAVSRADLASALVLGARVPQYLPGAPSYNDVRDLPTMAFVETAQASPCGALFTDVTKGGRFRPTEGVTRLVAAVALVRAAGLRSEAEAKANTPLSFLDALMIPAELRGYVSVAVSKGFIQADTLFLPQNSFTRGELAHALALIQNRAI